LRRCRDGPSMRLMEFDPLPVFASLEIALFLRLCCLPRKAGGKKSLDVNFTESDW
jgi:hypothetical protein